MVVKARGASQLRKGRRSEANRIYHVTTVTCERQPLFLDLRNARDVILSLRQQQELGSVSSLCFVVMPDHLHWLFALRGKKNLATVIRSVKTRSSRMINGRHGRFGSIWAPDFHDRAARYDDDILAMARYIVGNPVRAGLVPSIRFYPHWDAVWLRPGADLL